MSETSLTFEPRHENETVYMDVYALEKRLCLFLQMHEKYALQPLWHVLVQNADGCAEAVSEIPLSLVEAKALLEKTFYMRLHAGWPTLMSEVLPRS